VTGERGTGEADDRLEFLGQVAAWYYEDDLDQSAIASRIGKSRSMVSRLLREARDLGLVEIRVRFPLRTDPDLEAALIRAFGLRDVRVLSADGLDHESMVRRLGRLGSRVIQSKLHSEMSVTIGWGASLHAVVRALPEIRLDDVMVLQAMGSVGDGDPSVDGPELARALASKLNGDFRSLAAPVVVDREETASSLLSERTIATTLELAAGAELCLTGIGTIDSELSGLVRAGFFSDGQIEVLKELGIVGDLMGFLLDARGRVVDLPENRRVVALPPDRISGETVAVAGGAAKASAILAAVRGGYVDVLVTDSAAAESMLSIDRDASSDLVEV
jgi:DNA-binding transcriptional regulator LsrR (DeoR family)